MVAKHMLWALPLLAVTKLWFLPWFEGYAANAHCHDYVYFTGMHVVFYFIFVFLPIGTALLLFALEGRRCLNVIQVGQNPLPGEKVLRKTKYQYGARAKVKPYVVLLVLFIMAGLGVRGIFWANDIIDNLSGKPLACAGS